MIFHHSADRQGGGISPTSLLSHTLFFRGIPAVRYYEFYDGLTSFFRMYDLVYVLTKTVIFAFVLSSVASFYGYRIQGGALELGKANVNGFIVSSFLILVLNLVITSIML